MNSLVECYLMAMEEQIPSKNTKKPNKEESEKKKVKPFSIDIRFNNENKEIELQCLSGHGEYGIQTWVGENNLYNCGSLLEEKEALLFVRNLIEELILMNLKGIITNKSLNDKLILAANFRDRLISAAKQKL